MSTCATVMWCASIGGHGAVERGRGGYEQPRRCGIPAARAGRPDARSSGGWTHRSDRQRSPLFVGADSMLRANATGQLYLGVNDDYLSDNRGDFRVTVAVPSRGRHRQ